MVATLAATIALTMRDNGRIVSAARGTAIVVTLSSNATTGYSWHLQPIDSKIVRLISHRYMAPQTKPGYVGASGTAVWRFAAVTRGRAAIVLAYFRSFAPSQVARRFRVTIRVT